MQFISLSAGEHLHQGSDFNLVKSQGQKISPVGVALMKSIWSTSFASFTWISYRNSVHLRDTALFIFIHLLNIVTTFSSLLKFPKIKKRYQMTFE